MENTADRELRVTQIFNAPLKLLWEVWTSADHIRHWWGPAGFTTTIQEMELLVNGSMKLTLHAPEGTNYPNRSIYREIVPKKRIMLEHFNPHFFTTILFKPARENTQIEWSMVFDTPEQRDIIVKAHKADEGLSENIERLEQYLAFMNGEQGLTR